MLTVQVRVAANQWRDVKAHGRWMDAVTHAEQLAVHRRKSARIRQGNGLIVYRVVGDCPHPGSRPR